MNALEICTTIAFVLDSYIYSYICVKTKLPFLWLSNEHIFPNM